MGNKNFKIKHVDSIVINEIKTENLLDYVVHDFAFNSFDNDFNEYTQPVFPKTFPFVTSFDSDYSYIAYNIANLDYYNSMLTSLPEIFRKAKITQDVFHTMDKELKNIEFSIYNFTKNKRFTNARASALTQKEIKYGLTGGVNFSTSFRINRIIAKRILLKKFNIEKIKLTLKLFNLPIETTTITNSKENFEYVINFGGSQIEHDYLKLWKRFIMDFIPCWYDIKIIY